jgi:hypothetical protein
MYSYTAHGLCLKSELEFPNLPSCDKSEADVIIRFGRVEALRASSEPIATGDNFCITAEGIFIFNNGVCSLLMRDGREIILEPAGGVDRTTLSAFVLDLAGTLLHQRGRFVLHASAVAMGRGAVVFVGGSGRGKSTLALTLYAKGYPSVADDLVSIDLETDVPMVIPAYPELDASPEVLRALAHDPQRFERVLPTTEKRAVPTTERFAAHPLPLQRIYVLGEGEQTRIEPLSPRTALFALIRHSYRAEIAEGPSAAMHLLQSANLVQTMPVRCLTVHRSRASISTVARLVEADVLANRR